MLYNCVIFFMFFLIFYLILIVILACFHDALLHNKMQNQHKY